MSSELNLNETQAEYHGTLKGYVIGFIGALILTAASFSLVVFKLLAGKALLYTLVALALVQALLQLLCFLHLKLGVKDHWDTVVFYFMVLILLIVALGSLWIMNDLDERMMSGMHSM